MIDPPENHEDDREPGGTARPPDPGRAGPRFAREVEYHARAFLFGRYDRRGGATLILATHTATALRRYEERLGLHPDQDAGYDDLLAGGRVRLVVCDLPLPPAAGELLAGYGGIGPGRLLARVESRVIPPAATTGSGPWAETDLARIFHPPLERERDIIP